MTLESVGTPGFTSVHIAINLVYGRWFHGREKAQAKIDRFIDKLSSVSSERGIRYIDRKDFDAQIETLDSAKQ